MGKMSQTTLLTMLLLVHVIPVQTQADEVDVRFGEIQMLLVSMTPRQLSSPAPYVSPKIDMRRVDLHQIILAASLESNLEPAVLATLIKIESDFDADALSHAGAQGLTQLMPATAAELGISNVWNAKANVIGGAHWLEKLLKEHNNNLLAALAAYNAGSSVMQRPWGRWPSETRRYLKKFIRFYPEISLDWKKHTPHYINSRI